MPCNSRMASSATLQPPPPSHVRLSTAVRARQPQALRFLLGDAEKAAVLAARRETDAVVNWSPALQIRRLNRLVTPRIAVVIVIDDVSTADLQDRSAL